MDSIFDQSESPSESTRELYKKQLSQIEAQAELMNIFRDNHVTHSDKEPDWPGLMRNSKDDRERHEVMRTKDLWIKAQKERIFQAQQDAFEARVDEVLATPQHLRNKQFYDNLAKNSPSLSFNVRVQKQRRQDRQQLGLAFHLNTK